MKVVVDTDAFCKLQLAGLLTSVVGVLGAQLSDCARLPALPHMLRRGSVQRRYGETNCHSLIGIATAIPSLPVASAVWLDKFLPVPGIDPGEAHLFSVAADQQLLVLSGDKRALRSVGQVEGAVIALKGLIVTVEAALIAVHGSVGADALRRHIAATRPFDSTLAICFSDDNADPLAALWSYFNSLASEVEPLALWSPPSATP
jgi:hypothetical protein